MTPRRARALQAAYQRRRAAWREAHPPASWEGCAPVPEVARVPPALEGVDEGEAA